MPSSLKNNLFRRWLLRFANRFLLGNSRRVRGRQNRIRIGNAVLTGTKIRIQGDNNQVIIGDHVRLFRSSIRICGNNCTISLSGNGYFTGRLICGDDNSSITVGAGTTAEGATLASYEGASIVLENDCALGDNVEIRNSDVHAIFDAETRTRLNPPESVHVGRHVWLGSGVKILKGSRIGDHSVIGAYSIVTRTSHIPDHALALGSPVRPVRQDICWIRERSTTLP